MKIRTRRFQLTLLFLLLTLLGLTISAHRMRGTATDGRLNHPQLSTGAAKPTAVVPLQSGGNLNLTQSVLSGGGGTSTGGSQTLTSLLGQSVGGAASGGSFSLASGFLSGGGIVSQCPAITIDPPTLPTGQLGQPYSRQLSQTGSAGAITWSKAAGDLPGNVTLNSATGLLSGTPTASGTFNFTVKATDAAGCAGSRDYSLVISGGCPAIAISPASLPQGMVGTAYSQALTANGGASPYAFSISAGALPAGMALSGSAISGTPTVSGTFAFTVKARGANNCEGTQSYTLVVNPTATARVVRVIAANGSPGGTVVVPIELVAQGNENALGLSITFDPAVLGNPLPALGGDAAGALSNFSLSQAAAGRVGLSLALPSGQAFVAGARRIFNVTFTIAGTATASATEINFGDQPIAREIVSTAAAVLPAGYASGAVTIARGLEADVAPRPDGNGSVTISDWVQIGRFAAGTDAAANGGEFQRADCAPKDTRGNGAISISDWVQTGRYAAGLDEPAAAGGPTAPNSLSADSAGGGGQSGKSVVNRTATRRSLRLRPADGAPGRIALMLDAFGDENALGFSLLFNPSQWRFVSATQGGDALDAVLHLNTLQASRGRLGVAMALPANRMFAGGERQLLSLTFEPAEGSDDALPLITAFSDAPVPREIVAADAVALATSYAVTFNGETLGLLTNVSAASFKEGELARGEIVAAFSAGGARLAMQSVATNQSALTTELARTRVAVTDSRGVTRNARLLFASPTQINYQMPAETADGAATVTVVRDGKALAIGVVFVSAGQALKDQPDSK